MRRAPWRGSCELVENPAQILYGFANVRVPLKQVFLPQTEVLCTYDFDQVSEVPLPAETILVFGCRPCDARAMAQLDTVFGPENKGYADPYFRKRRESAVVIALACASPCPTCFCTAMGGGPAGTEGADLLAHDLARAGASGVLLLEAVTDKGRALLEAHPDLLTEAGPQVSEEAKRADAAAEAAVRQANDLGVDLGGLSALREHGPGLRRRALGGADRQAASAAAPAPTCAPPATASTSPMSPGCTRGGASAPGTPASSRCSPNTPPATTRGRTRRSGCASASCTSSPMPWRTPAPRCASAAAAASPAAR